MQHALMVIKNTIAYTQYVATSGSSDCTAKATAVSTASAATLYHFKKNRHTFFVWESEGKYECNVCWWSVLF